jgi:hypothetical protein
MVDWEQEILQVFQQGFSPPFTGEIYEWAHNFVNLQSGYSITGLFDVGISPHLKKIFEAYKDNRVREINILAPPRSGKTMAAELCLLHNIAHNSGDAVWFQLSDEMSAKMVDLRLMPLIKSCKPVFDLLSSDKYNLQNQKFKFNHSTIHFTSPKPNSLNSVGYRFIFMDEVWKFEQGIIQEIKRRADDYKGISKIMCFSQGGLKDSAWYEQYHLGEQYEYGFTCPNCNQLQTFEFQKKRADNSYGGITWNEKLKDDNGFWDIKACAKDAKLECFHCKHSIQDEPQSRKSLLDNGDYIKVGEGDSTIKSFRFTNLVNIKISFAELVTRFLAAKQKLTFIGSTEDLEAFHTKDMAAFWDATPKRDRVEIRQTDFDTSKPFGEFEKHRFMAIDCQRTEPFFYYGIASVNTNNNIRVIKYGKANTWAELDAIRQTHRVDYRFVGVDTGDGMNQEALRSQCVHYGRWCQFGNDRVWGCFTSLKGSGLNGFHHKADNKIYRYNEGEEHFVAAMNEEDEGKTLLSYTWSNLRYKTILESLRNGQSKVKLEFNEVTDELTTHLNSEHLARNPKTGKWEYQVKLNAPNHWWDVLNMILVMMDITGCLDTADSSEVKTEG